MKSFNIVAAVLLSLGASHMALAADYPSRPITMVVPFSPGGVSDTIGRPLATLMPKNTRPTDHRMATPIQYLDALEFDAFWHADAEQQAQVIKAIGNAN